MKQIDYVLQENNFDCGIASLLTIFNYYNIFYNRDEVLSYVKDYKQGISAYDLVKISNIYNLNCKGVKTTIDNLNNSYFPCIAHIVTKEGYCHYVVILSKNNDSLSIMDPAYGIKNILIDDFIKLSTNVFILFDGLVLKKKHDKRFEKFIFTIFKKEKKYIVLTFICSLIFIFFTIINNYYLKLIINNVNNDSLILKISFVFLFIIILKNIFDYLRKWLNIKLSFNCDKYIFSKVINHIIHLPYKYYLKKSTGEIFTIINDIENFKDIIVKVFIFLMIDLVLIFIMLIYISFYSIYYLLIMIFLVFFLILFTNRYRYKYNDYYVRLKSSKINYNSKVINCLSFFESIKNLHIENRILRKILFSYDEVLNNNKKFNSINNKYGLFYNLILDIFYIFIILVSSIMTINNNLDFTNIILFSSMYFSINSFILDLTDILVMYKVYYISIKNVLDVLDHPDEKFNKCKLKTINRIEYKNVSIDNLNINNINMCLKKGDRLFIKGDSGVGKSTLMKMLLKYLDDYDGDIIIDDINIKDLDLSFLRENITYVGQNEFLYNDTIYNNLKIVNCSDMEIEKTCLVTGLNFDLSYFLEENGVNISGGERKRIILTRALLKLKNVLILDEVFNEIEINDEKKILNNIIKTYPDIIIVYISHRNGCEEIFNKKYELKVGLNG